MPIKYFECKAGIVECNECLKGCLVFDRCLTRPTLVKACENRPFTGNFSTTQLISGTREEMLKIKHDYTINPKDSIYMLFGTDIHEKLELHAGEQELAENVFKDGLVSGIADLYDKETQTLYDYKTMGSYKAASTLGIGYNLKDTEEYYVSGPKKGQLKQEKDFFIDPEQADMFEFELQLNNYRMMFEKLGYKVRELKLQIMVRDGNTQIATSRGVTEPVYMVDVKILPDTQVIDYFTSKDSALRLALETGYAPKCNNRECWEGRKCEKYCKVKDWCNEMGD